MTSSDVSGTDVQGSDSDVAQQNAAIVQTIYSAFERRDIAAIVARLADDVVWTEPDNPWNPAAGTRHGHAGFLEWARVGSTSEEILSLDVRHLIADAHTVAVIGHTRCKALITGKTYDTDFVHLVTIRNRRVTRFQEFFDTYAAAEAFRSDQIPRPDPDAAQSGAVDEAHGRRARRT